LFDSSLTRVYCLLNNADIIDDYHWNAAAQRGILWTATLACALLAAIANALGVLFFRFDLSSLMLAGSVPVGLMALGSAATGGFLVAATRAQLNVRLVTWSFFCCCAPAWSS
jgi:hypothetical protein